MSQDNNSSKIVNQNNVYGNNNVNIHPVVDPINHIQFHKSGYSFDSSIGMYKNWVTFTSPNHAYLTDIYIELNFDIDVKNIEGAIFLIPENGAISAGNYETKLINPRKCVFTVDFLVPSNGVIIRFYSVDKPTEVKFVLSP